MPAGVKRAVRLLAQYVVAATLSPIGFCPCAHPHCLVACRDPSMAAAQAEMLRQLPDRIGGGLAQPLPLLHTG